MENEIYVTQGAMISYASCFGLNKASCVYVSTPITTGKNYLKWLKLGNENDLNDSGDNSLTREVFVTVKNIQQAAELVLKVRAKYSDPVIDPTALEDVEGWSQNDYHQFWLRVIQKSVSVIVFADGWEYSSGSTLEYLCGLEKGVALLNQDFQPLSPDLALLKLNSAVAEYRELEEKSDILEGAIDFLDNFIKVQGTTGD